MPLLSIKDSMLHFVRTVLVLICLSAVAAGAWSATIIYGRVTDVETGEPLLGVNLQLTRALVGTSTDAQGRYRLPLPSAGEWTIRVTHLGYRSAEKTFQAIDSLKLDFALRTDFLQGSEVVITAEAHESTARLSTTRVEVVGPKEIEEKSPETLDRVLDAVPGVEVHRTGGTVVSNVSIRGSSDMLGGGVGNRTLLLVDGRPAVIADTDGAAWWLYPEDIVERVEIVKGAYSSLYGSNAMGGVVNLITRTPRQREFTRIRATYGVHQRPPGWMRYTESTAALSTLSFSHSNSVGRLGYFAGATRRASDGHRQNSGYENLNFFSKFKFDYSPTRSFTLSTLYNAGENDYPHAWQDRAHPLEIRESYTNDLQRKQNFSADLLYRRVDSPQSSYAIRVFFNRDLTRSILNPETDPREEDVALNLQTRSTSRKFGISDQITRLLPYNNTLVFGAEAVWDEIEGVPESYLYGRQSAFSPAVFVQDEFVPHPRLRFTAGARFDYRNLRGGKKTSHLSPKAGVSYEVVDDLVLRGAVGHAFRNPSFAEMFLKKVGTQDYEFIPNPDLEPESVNFGELGFNLRIDEHAVVDGAVFRYEYEDVIRWEVVEGGRYRTKNLSEAVIQGFEYGVKLAWPRFLKQTAHVTYLDTDIDNRGPLTYVPEYRYYWSGAYEYKRMTLSADVRYVTETDTVVFYQNDAPDAYTLLGLRMNLRFRQNTQINFILDNATNEQYEEMERYRMPPRTFRVELLYEFDVGKE